jgi:hypothetical protein
MKHHILEGTSIVPVDLMTWAQWMETFENRRIALDAIGGITVSTVFLGIDHNFSGEGGPILFESLVSHNYQHESGNIEKRELEMVRYRTHEEAMEGHKMLVLRAACVEGIIAWAKLPD